MRESYLHSIIRRFTYHKRGAFCFCLLAVFIVLAIIAPLIAPYEPTEISASFAAPPSAEHWLGTDQIGRDILSRLLYGMRVSLFVGVMATLVSTVIGTVLGLISGYFGGVADMIIMRIADMLMSFPYILLVLVSAMIVGPGMWNIILILGIVDWPGVARLVRGSVMEIRSSDFVHSSEIAGMPRRYILFSDIMPNIISPVLVFASSVMAQSILDESALSFLGMGVQPPQASLGNMLNDAQSLTVLTSMPWLWLPPGVMIILIVVCVNFVGDAFRDAIDSTMTR